VGGCVHVHVTGCHVKVWRLHSKAVMCIQLQLIVCTACMPADQPVVLLHNLRLCTRVHEWV
jgi:hypothetical protein